MRSLYRKKNTDTEAQLGSSTTQENPSRMEKREGEENIREGGESHFQEGTTENEGESNQPSTYSQKFRAERSSIIGEPTDQPFESNKLSSETTPKPYPPGSDESESKRKYDSKKAVRKGLKTGMRLIGTTIKHGAAAAIKTGLTPSVKGPSDDDHAMIRGESHEMEPKSRSQVQGHKGNAPIEHLAVKLAHTSHSVGSKIGHFFAKSLRNLEMYVEVDEEKRIELERRASMLGINPETGERKSEEELTSIEDINIALHELSDLISAKLLVLRERVLELASRLDERETQAILTGDDMVRKLSRQLKKHALNAAIQTTHSVKAAITEKEEAPRRRRRRAKANVEPE